MELILVTLTWFLLFHLDRQPEELGRLAYARARKG
jgi:hypothetical protein